VAFSKGVKFPGCEADRIPPTSAEVKETWIYRGTFLDTDIFTSFRRVKGRKLRKCASYFICIDN
jgi:hypothetical protein